MIILEPETSVFIEVKVRDTVEVEPIELFDMAAEAVAMLDPEEVTEMERLSI